MPKADKEDDLKLRLVEQEATSYPTGGEEVLDALIDLLLSVAEGQQEPPDSTLVVQAADPDNRPADQEEQHGAA